MAGYVRFAIGEGITSAQYAYVDVSGTRYPSSGYYSTSTGTALSNVDHLYIYDIVYDSGYYGWNAVYGKSSLYDSNSVLPTSGSSNLVQINIYPSSSTTSSNRATVTITSVSASSTFTLQYRSNDGTTILYTDTGTSYSGSYTFTIRSYAPPPSYHYFVGWANYSGATSSYYTGGESLTVYGTRALYAVFAPYTPTIYKQIWYRDNSSDSYSYQSTSRDTVTAGYSYTPSAHIPTHDSNYELTQIIDGNGADYTTGSFVVPNDGVTLIYRFTRRENTFTLQYNANGGSDAPNSQTATSTESSYTFTVRSGTPTRSGYIFQGWSDSSSATSADYWAGSRITVYGTRTLWAVWATAYTHTLSYHANGGSGSPSTESVTDANTTHTFIVSNTVPTRSGYDFLGWSTNSSATSPDFESGESIVVATSVVLYAVWKEQKKALVPIATFTITSRTDTTMTITVTQTNLEAGLWSFQISTDSNFGSYISAGSSVGFQISSLSSVFSGLTPNAYYYVRVWNMYNGITLYSILNGGGRTGISSFSWTNNDSVYVVAGAVPRAAISSLKWNALYAKIDEVSRRQGAGGVVYSSVYPNQRITHTLFNIMRDAISSLSGSSGTPSTQSKGKGMKASLFVALKDSINNAINYTNNNF